jgi:alpha-beta hydrolase superfamily lysophospholipase
VVATLVHRPLRTDADGDAHRAPVLLLHGWSDYVFGRHVTEFLGQAGHEVWALDTRRHGRSLRPGNVPTLLHDLRDLDLELEAALAEIREPPVILAHSMGGLVACDWVIRHPGSVRALVLNSPWLEFQGGPLVRGVVQVVTAALARVWPYGVQPVRLDGHYARTLHRDFEGEFDYDLGLKPVGGNRMPFATAAAVTRAQGRLARDPRGRGGPHHRAQVPAQVPVLLLRSADTRIRPMFDREMFAADVVVDVHGIDPAVRRVAPHARIEVLDGAVHDVFLSARPVRERALDLTDEFLREVDAG